MAREAEREEFVSVVHEEVVAWVQEGWECRRHPCAVLQSMGDASCSRVALQGEWTAAEVVAAACAAEVDREC